MSIWQPGPRPDWVRRFNRLGEPAWIPIEGEALLQEAQTRTGLSDFGGNSWREGFDVFVAALESEAQLNMVLWRWTDPPDALKVIDDEDRLGRM